MVQINFEPNSIQAGGTGVGCVNEYNISWPSLEQELAALKRETAGEPRIAPAVEELETTVKAREPSGIAAVIKKHAAEFTSTAFANLASAGILELIKAVLH